MIEQNDFDLEMYKERILELAKRQLNKHPLKAYSVKQEKSNPLCGDKVIIYLKIKKSLIEDGAFEGDGCAISQSAASLLTEEIKKKKVAEVAAFSDEKMLALLGIPISHLRQKCALLALQAVREGLGSLAILAIDRNCPEKLLNKK